MSLLAFSNIARFLFFLRNILNTIVDSPNSKKFPDSAKKCLGVDSSVALMYAVDIYISTPKNLWVKHMYALYIYYILYHTEETLYIKNIKSILYKLYTCICIYVIKQKGLLWHTKNWGKVTVITIVAKYIHSWTLYRYSLLDANLSI